MRWLRRVSFLSCHKKDTKEGHLGETLSVVLPHAKPLSPKDPTRRALGRDGTWFRLWIGAVDTLRSGTKTKVQVRPLSLLFAPVYQGVIAPGNHEHSESLRYSQRESLYTVYRHRAQRLSLWESWHGFAVTERAMSRTEYRLGDRVNIVPRFSAAPM